MCSTDAKTGIYRCKVVTHDYLFFTTLGFRDTTLTRYIGNYALIYAINRNIQTIQRNASGTKPFYQEDLSKVLIYATPAALSSDKLTPLAVDKSIEWTSHPKAYVTFNSVNTLTQMTETGRANLPQIGRKAKYPPLNSFNFFAIGGNPAGIIRLGKKQIPCRVFTTPLKIEQVSEDLFEPSHPVNPSDLPDFSPKEIDRAEIVYQTPPLLVNVRLRAEHYICTDGRNKFYIAKPDPIKYLHVSLP